MYYVELIYLDWKHVELTRETIQIYASSQAEADIKAYEAYLNSTADDYELKQE